MLQCFRIRSDIFLFGGEITTNAVLLVDADSGEVLFSKNADEQIYPASTTKLMTALLTIENASLDDEVTVGDEVTGFPSGSSLLGMTSGETLTIRDLLHGIFLVSGNDAASALAVHIGGTQEQFVDMMNARAQELGMTHTNFVNPHGIKDDNHYTTASDMALLAREVLKHEELVSIASTETYTIPANEEHSEDRELENTNRLIYTGTNADGEPIEENR